MWDRMGFWSWQILVYGRFFWLCFTNSLLSLEVFQRVCFWFHCFKNKILPDCANVSIYFRFEIRRTDMRTCGQVREKLYYTSLSSDEDRRQRKIILHFALFWRRQTSEENYITPRSLLTKTDVRGKLYYTSLSSDKDRRQREHNIFFITSWSFLVNTEVRGKCYSSCSF